MLLGATGYLVTNILILIVGSCLAVPGAVFTFLGIRDRTERLEERRINQLIAKQLVGEHAVNHPPELTPDNPSIRDLLHDVLGESAASTAELAIIREILRIHVSDTHGPPIPDYLLRK